MCVLQYTVQLFCITYHHCVVDLLIFCSELLRYFSIISVVLPFQQIIDEPNFGPFFHPLLFQNQLHLLHQIGKNVNKFIYVTSRLHPFSHNNLADHNHHY